MKTSKEPIYTGWSYQHSIGIISVAGWGNPFLVVTENLFWEGQRWGYNYYKLGAECSTEDVGKEAARELRVKYGLPENFLDKSDFYDSDSSQALLLQIAADFPNAEIKRN